MLWHHYPLFFHQYQIPYHSETRLKVQNIQYSLSLVPQSPPAPEARLLSPGPRVLLWSQKEGEAWRGRELLWALILRGTWWGSRELCTDRTGRTGLQGHSGIPSHGEASLHFEWPLNDPILSLIPRDDLMMRVHGSWGTSALGTQVSLLLRVCALGLCYLPAYCFCQAKNSLTRLNVMGSTVPNWGQPA